MTLLYSILHRELVCNSPRKQISLDFALDSFVCHRVDEHPIHGKDSGVEVPPFASSFSKNAGDKHHLAVADEDGSVRVLDTNKYGRQAIVVEWTAHSNAIFDVAWMHNEAKLVTASGDQTARLWDVTKETSLAVFKGHSCSLKSVDFRKNDQFTFATGARDGNIMVWDTRCNQRRDHYQPVNTIYSAHTQQLTTPMRARKRSRRASTPQPVTDSQQSVTAVVFHGDDLLISAGAMDGNLKMWDLRKYYTMAKQDPVPYHMFPYPGKGPRKHGFSSLVLDSNQSKLYASCTNDHIYMYECSVLGEDPVCSFTGHSNSTFYVKAALSPDDNYLLSGSSDNNAYIWKVSDADRPPVCLRGHAGEVTSVVWCPQDITKVVTCSDDTTVRIWRMNRGVEFQERTDYIGFTERMKTQIQPHSTSKQEQNGMSTTPQNKSGRYTYKVHTNPRLNPLSSPVAKVTIKRCNTPPKKLTIKCACPTTQPTKSPVRAGRTACPVSPLTTPHISSCPLSPGVSSPKCQSPQQLLRSWLKVTPPRKNSNKHMDDVREEGSKGQKKQSAMPRLRKGLEKALSECAVQDTNQESKLSMQASDTSPSLSPARKRQCIMMSSENSDDTDTPFAKTMIVVQDNKENSEPKNHFKDKRIVNASQHIGFVDERDIKHSNWLTTWSRLQRQKNGSISENKQVITDNCNENGENCSPTKDNEDTNVTFLVAKPEESILHYFKPTLSPIKEYIR